MMTEERCDMMMMVVVPTQILTSTTNNISGQYFLLCLGSSPILPPIFAHTTFLVFEERFTRLINIYSLVKDNDIMFVES